MNIVLVKTEDEEHPFCAESLAGHAVEFVEDIGAVPRNADIASVVIHWRVGVGFYHRHPKMKRVVSRSSASDHLDPKAAARRGVGLARVPNCGAATVAERAFALILGVTRRLCHCLDRRKPNRGAIARRRGLELRGKTSGLAGTGCAGSMVLAIGKAFGMDCVVFDREAAAELAGPTGFRRMSLDKLLRCSGLVTLPVLLNLRTRRLLAYQNVFFTPQVGFNGIEAIGRIHRGKVQIIRDFLSGRLCPNAEVAP